METVEKYEILNLEQNCILRCLWIFIKKKISNKENWLNDNNKITSNCHLVQ